MTTIARAQPGERETLLLRASRHPLARTISEGLRLAGVTDHDPLVVAASGGADSTAMLVLLAGVRARVDPSLRSLSVVSIDHGIRAANADEAASVLALASRLGIARAAIVRVEVARSGNLLDAARSARLDALRAEAAAFGASHIALAHHAEDRAESLLLALSRTGGADALASLRGHRELDEGLTLVRPLLRARRAELRALLRELGMGWHEDPSNALRTRGAMRGDPSLAALVDRIAEGAGSALDEVAQLVAWRDTLAAHAVPEGARAMTRDAFDALPPPVRAAALLRLGRNAGTQVSRAALELCTDLARDDRAPRAFDCSGGRTLRVDARSVTVD